MRVNSKSSGTLSACLYDWYLFSHGLAQICVLIDMCSSPILEFEPPHDKTNKMAVRPAKTQISLGMRPV